MQLSFLAPVQAQESGQQVENLRIWHSPNRTRVVFDVSENVTHHMFTLQAPLRLVVDIENADLTIKLPVLDKDNQHISAIRSGRPVKDTLRFVFELKQPLDATDFVLSPNELYGHRLVVDMEAAGMSISGAEKPVSLASTPRTENKTSNNQISTAESTVVAERTRTDPAAKGGSSSIVAASVAPVSGESNTEAARGPIIIAIDAGHGGEDPGALGYRGSREKVLTLSIAKRLKKIIDADPAMQSYMVRTGDYYINLHKRRQMARAAGADMFISIHADAFTKRSARGFSVFALSQSGATSAMARALAAKENASDLIGGVSLADKDEVLAKVLVDLSMTNTISESVNFGGRLLKELGKLGRLHSKRVEQAGFAVLKSADIPSVLVETGFITNPDEERKLRTGRYQQQVAAAIYTAISKYFDQTPYSTTATYAAATPAQADFTSLVKPKRPSYHKVVRGDSLSKIAQRYGTSVKELKQVNKLRSDVAVLGQRLKLPGNASAAASPTRSNTGASKPAFHTVKRGDSLSKISARYNVTIKSLKSINNLTRNTVYPGQKLWLSSRAAQAQPAKARTHKVRRGDTLSEIAEQYGSSMNKIMQANALRTRTVMLGQVLVIPN
ncbi:MAG: N-acetylmuramoyl-L-alanine amidase [Pseudomonadota bacterium]